MKAIPEHAFNPTVFGLAFIVRMLLLNYCSVVEDNTKWIPFFNSRYSDYEQIKEAIYMVERGQDPYFLDHIFQVKQELKRDCRPTVYIIYFFFFQKPLMVYFFYYIREFPIIINLIYAFTDMTVGAVITSQYFLHKNVNILGLDVTSLQLIYLFNPLTLIAVANKWTSIFEYSFIFIALTLFFQKKYIPAALSFAASVYLQPSFLLFSTLFLLLAAYEGRKLNTDDIKEILSFFFVGFCFLVFLLALSVFMTDSTNFLKKCYYNAYFPEYYEKSLTLSWAIFSGIFLKFKDFYSFAFMIFPVFYAYPLFTFFQKYIRSQKIGHGSMGVMASFMLVIKYFYFQYSTINDLFFAVFLLYTAYQFSFRIQIIIIITATLVILIIISSSLAISLLYGLSSNNNFLFFPSTIVTLITAIWFSEVLREMKKEIVQAKAEMISREIILDVLEEGLSTSKIEKNPDEKKQPGHSEVVKDANAKIDKSVHKRQSDGKAVENKKGDKKLNEENKKKGNKNK